MNVAPVCECPKCSTLGLHLMASINQNRVSRVVEWVTLVEVPTVQWYDLREEKPLTELKTKRELHETIFIKTYVVRECYNCSYHWEQYWKEDHELWIQP